MVLTYIIHRAKLIIVDCYWAGGGGGMIQCNSQHYHDYESTCHAFVFCSRPILDTKVQIQLSGGGGGRGAQLTRAFT